MINSKTASFQNKKTVLKNQSTYASKKRNIYKNIHKCPVNTLLTNIFSGIAWNG